MSVLRRIDEPTVDVLLDRITRLVAERQELRAQDAGAAVLERNRRELVRCHQELAKALIERHAASSPEQHAA